MKRIMLFLATNLAIIIVLSITASLLGFDHRFEQGGGNWGSVLGFAFIFGMGGAFISLWMSKGMAKASMGVQIIDQPRNATESWLVDTVRRQAEQAGIGMPEVGIFNSPDPNAFATGASRNNALVAVSTGLMHHMNQDEVEAVLAHEVSHVANGDMITMTLIQGVVNTFVIFLARAIAAVIDSFTRGDNEEGEGLGTFAYMGVVIVAEIVLGILASIIVMWFSRQREYRADEGGARLAGRQNMISALERLRQGQAGELPSQLAAFGISGGLKNGLGGLFLSHPPLEDRISSLQQNR